MKQLKSIVVMALMSVVTTVAFAQAPKNNQSNVPAPAVLTAEEITSIRAALASAPAASMGMLPEDSTYFVGLLESNNNPIATRVAQAGTLCGTIVEDGDSVRLFIVRTQGGFDLFCDVIRDVAKQVIVANPAKLSLDTAIVNTQFVEKQHEGRPRYRDEYDVTLGKTSVGRIVEKASDKFGFGIIAGGTYQMGNGLYGFGGELGLSYSISDRNGKWFVMPEAVGSIRRTKYNSNAENAGEHYTAYGTEGTLFGGVALGEHGDHRLAVGAGIGWEFYSTDSQKRVYADGSWDELSSKGNYVYPQFKLRYTYDGYNSPVGFFAGIGVRQHKSVWQNQGSDKSWMPTAEAGLIVKLFRHVTNNK